MHLLKSLSIVVFAVILSRNGFLTRGAMQVRKYILSTYLVVDKASSTRITKASQAFGRLRQRIWNSHSIKLPTKIALYNAIELSTLLYGSETWTLHARHVKQLNAFH